MVLTVCARAMPAVTVSAAPPFGAARSWGERRDPQSPDPVHTLHRGPRRDRRRFPAHPQL